MDYEYEYYFAENDENRYVIWRRNTETEKWEVSTKYLAGTWFTSAVKDEDFKPNEKYDQKEVPAWAR